MICFLCSSQLILQDCDEASQPYTNPDDKCIFLRRWNPATYTLSPMQEIIIAYEGKRLKIYIHIKTCFTIRISVHIGQFDFRDLISNVSSIATDDVEYCKVNGSFPKYNISLTSVHTNSMWRDKPMFTDELPLSAARFGEMYLYR